MTKSHYGLIAGFAGALFAAWQWRRSSRDGFRQRNLAHERGEVIFSNTPHPSDAF